MAVFVADELPRQAWEFMDFEGPRHPCFSCGNPVGEGLVVIWMGSVGSGNIESAPDDIRPVLEEMAQRGGVQAAGHIFFHPTCIPYFCRCLLEDWERTVDLRELRKMTWPEAEDLESEGPNA